MPPPNRPPPLFPRNVHGFIGFHDLMLSDRGFHITPHMVPVAAALIDERIKNLIVVIGPGSSKSTLISVAYPAFVIGHDPTVTILGLSAGEGLMQGFQHAVGEWIENSMMWKRAFPGVRPNKAAGWSSERGLFVNGRPPGDPDASYFVAGLTSAALTGKHARVIICDDIHNRQNSGSSMLRLAVVQQWYDTIVGRADPQGAKFVVTGRRWATDDLYGHLISSGDFVVMELPAEREGSLDIYWDVKIPDRLECCFTDGSLIGVERINDVRAA